ncbi:MAG: hypothetical protein AAB410_02195 [Patescibacteria group bacterium]
MHNGLITKERWESLGTYNQLANIGSEVGRAFKWKKAGVKERADGAFFRAWELFDATLNDGKNQKRKREINIAKELFADLFFDRHDYMETPEHLEKYFTDFAILSKQSQ